MERLFPSSADNRAGHPTCSGQWIVTEMMYMVSGEEFPGPLGAFGPSCSFPSAREQGPWKVSWVPGRDNGWSRATARTGLQRTRGQETHLGHRRPLKSGGYFIALVLPAESWLIHHLHWARVRSTQRRTRMPWLTDALRTSAPGSSSSLVTQYMDTRNTPPS